MQETLCCLLSSDYKWDFLDFHSVFYYYKCLNKIYLHCNKYWRKSMMRFWNVLPFVLFVFLLCDSTFAQKVASGKQKTDSDPILATIGKDKITVSEFERLYAKSANMPAKKNIDSTSVNDRRQFLDMFVNYRVKLAEAYRQHLDTNREILDELGQYRKNIAASYYIDKHLIEPGAKLLYDRKKIEIHAAHIYFAKKKNQTPEDTLKLYQKALNVLAKAHAGVSFDSLAREYSEDISTKLNGGDLGIFSSGFMLPQVEDECYALNGGEISKNVICSEYGYHIIKVFGRSPAANERCVSHIYVDLSREDTPADTLKKYQRLMALRDSILRGADFGSLARQVSEDAASAVKNGDIGFIPRRRTISNFDQFIYNSKVGDISQVVRSRSGYHILKITGERPLGSYDELKESIRDTYKKTRYTDDLRQMMSRLEKELNAEIDDKTITIFLQKLDTSKTTSSVNWDSLLTSTDRSLILYRFADKKIELDTLISYLKSGTEIKNVPLKTLRIKDIAARVLENYVLGYMARNLEDESPEFTGIMKEYREGLMIYKLDQDNVWSKVVIKDSDLHTYYKKHRSEYRFGDRVDFSEIAVSNDSLAKVLIDSIKSGVEFDSIVVRHSIRVGMRKKLGRYGMTDTTGNRLAQEAYAMEVGTVSQKPFNNGSFFSIIKVHAKDPAREKTFEEASSEVTTPYQDIITQKINAAWIKELKKKTPVKIYEKVFAEKYSKK